MLWSWGQHGRLCCFLHGYPRTMWEIFKPTPLPTAGPQCVPCAYKHYHPSWFLSYIRWEKVFSLGGTLLAVMAGGVWGWLPGSLVLVGARRRPLRVCFRHLTSGTPGIQGACRIYQEIERGLYPSSVWFGGHAQHNTTERTWFLTQNAERAPRSPVTTASSCVA